MAALLDQTVKKIKGPAGASVNNASGMLWAADCCSSAGHWDIQPDCVTLQATSVQENNALWFQNDCLPPATLLLTTVISKYGPRGGEGQYFTSESSMGALWYVDQFLYWVKRLINIERVAFACVTHGHNFPGEKWEQNPDNFSPCRFWIGR